MKFPQGVILAGGKSRRFGSNKAMAMWKGQTFLEHTINLLKRVNITQPVIIASENNHRQYEHLKHPVVIDIYNDKGPLSGLYTALMNCSGRACLVLTCDMIFLSPEVLSPLLEESNMDWDLVLYQSKSCVLQPFPAIYSYRLLRSIKSHLLRDQLSMRNFIRAVEAKKTLELLHPPENFKNINAPKELGQ